MTMISIPFLPRFKQPMLDGVKTHTCRSTCYGQPGDRFRKWGAVFELTAVWETMLEDVATNYWKQEGCTSPQEFVGVWNEIHPQRWFIGTDKKWVHCFRKVGP